MLELAKENLSEAMDDEGMLKKLQHLKDYLDKKIVNTLQTIPYTQVRDYKVGWDFDIKDIQFIIQRVILTKNQLGYPTLVFLIKYIDGQIDDGGGYSQLYLTSSSRDTIEDVIDKFVLRQAVYFAIKPFYRVLKIKTKDA